MRARLRLPGLREGIRIVAELASDNAWVAGHRVSVTNEIAAAMTDFTSGDVEYRQSRTMLPEDGYELGESGF